MPPAIHAVQHERAGRAGMWSQRGRLYRWSVVEPAGGTAILHPQDSASTAAAPQWEPRKPLAGSDVGDQQHRYEERPQREAGAGKSPACRTYLALHLATGE